jgi:hypothetical protein
MAVALNSFILYLTVVLLFVTLLVFTAVRKVRRIGSENIAGNRALGVAIILGFLLIPLTTAVLASPMLPSTIPWIIVVPAGGFVLLLILTFFVVVKRL